ncbi:MAG TPA: YkgJ family cysteine cluster protein [Planctomycetota bacterium]|nr:YkgJ family cysteine cluster protein [Planctomycetota bacterium]
METRDGFPFRFACRRSGNCCSIPGGIVRVTAEDVAAIAAHLGLPVAAFSGLYLQPGHGDQRLLKEGLGGRCVFLKDGAQAECAIHPVRPDRCRQWPFWPEVRDDPALRERVLRTCPGIEPLPAPPP